MTYLVRELLDKSHNLLNLSSTTSFRGNDLPVPGTCGSEQESAKPFHEIDFKNFDRLLHLLGEMTHLVRGLVDQSRNLLNLLTNPLKDSDLPGPGTYGSET